MNRRVLFALLASMLAAACGNTSTTPAANNVTIRWTSYGVPHITASDFRGAGYGQGYAYATENICVLADQIVKVRSERSKWFGPGSKDVNVTSDWAYKAMEVMPKAQKFLDTQVSDTAKELIGGYVAGYNARLAEVGADGLPTPCKGATWVQPITTQDLMAYYADLALLASARNFKEYLVIAHPPTTSGANEWLDWLTPADKGEQALAFGKELDPLRKAQIGSNGWGLGKDKVVGGLGAVVGNPHFPWFGELRLWESHLTIPGVLDVAGASLSGVAGVLIGHNAHVAWTETVSASRKFTAYKLALKAGDPTTYLVDGVEHKMTSHEETIQVKQDDGTLKEQTHTFWKSHHGPMIVVGGVGEWTDTVGWTLHDGNGENGKLVDHFLGFALAKSVADLETVCKTVQANPWTNSMAADDAGHAFYTESHSTPDISDEVMNRWNDAVKTDVITGIVAQNGVVLLDGTTAANDWTVEAGGREPGLTPWDKTPHLTRDDFVFNANDSHWLTNPAKLLEGYNQMFGPERTKRSTRTRLNLEFLTKAGADAAAGEDGKFTLEELTAMVMNDRIHSADLALADVVTACQDVTSVVVDGTAVDLVAPCTVLKNWQKNATATGKGALLWREFWSDTSVPWAHPFDVADPIGTPYGVPTTPAGPTNAAVQALAKAAAALQKANIPLDAAVPDFEYTMKGAERLPIHGSDDWEGAFQVVGWVNGENDTLLPDLRMATPPDTLTASGRWSAGYPINYGSSFIMVCVLGPDGPRAQAILTYGQSSDPKSPHFIDQPKLFSDRKFRPTVP